jgi:hypothetical protein
MAATPYFALVLLAVLVVGSYVMMQPRTWSVVAVDPLAATAPNELHGLRTIVARLNAELDALNRSVADVRSMVDDGATTAHAASDLHYDIARALGMPLLPPLPYAPGDLRDLPLDKRRLSLFFNNLHFEPYTPSDRHAIVTIATASHWPNALAFFASVLETQTRVPNLVLIRPKGDQWAPDVEQIFSSMGVRFYDLEPVPLYPNVKIPGGWDVAWNKLGIWTLTQFDSVLFSDADTIFVQNIDHVLEFPELSSPYSPGNCACNDHQGLPGRHLFPEPVNYYAIGSGMFVAKPSMKRYEQIMDVSSRPSPDPIDQNQYKGDWHWGDMEMLRVIFDQLEDSWHPLPYGFDVVVGACDCEWLKPYNISTLHYSCAALAKPWLHTPQDVHQGAPRCQFEAWYAWMYLFAKALNEHAPASPNNAWRRGPVASFAPVHGTR